MWFTGKNYYNLADEKDRNFIFYDSYNHIWKPGLKLLHATYLQLELYCVIRDVFGCMIRLNISNVLVRDGMFLKLTATVNSWRLFRRNLAFVITMYKHSPRKASYLG
jgi:hypothetical protein